MMSLSFRRILTGVLACILLTGLGAVSAQAVDVSQLGGRDGVETSVQVFDASDAWSDIAVIVQAGSFADAVTATPLAAMQKSRVLLNPSDKLDPRVLKALVKHKVKRVIIVGGTASISNNVAQGVAGLGIIVERIAGNTRYETNLQVAKAIVGIAGAAVPIFVVTGSNYVDALVAGAGAGAAKIGGVVIMAPATQPLSPGALELARRAGSIYAIGGPGGGVST